MLALRAAVLVGAVLVLLQVAPVLLCSALSIAAGVLGLRAWTRVGERMLTELRAGYTTLTLDLGGFWTGGARRYRHNGAPWDFRGAWVYDSRGRLRAAPDPSLDRPGLYPSPTAPGRYEVWTGCVWSGHLRDRPL